MACWMGRLSMHRWNFCRTRSVYGQEMQPTSPSWRGWRRKWETTLTLSRRFEPKISLWHNNNNRNNWTRVFIKFNFRVSCSVYSVLISMFVWWRFWIWPLTLRASVSLHRSDTNWPTKWHGSLWRGEISASCIMPGRSPTALWVKETAVSDTVTQHRTDWLTRRLFCFYSRFPGQKQWPLVQKHKRCKSTEPHFSPWWTCQSVNDW